ncbi:MAG: hypothetical protein WB615_02820 [Candidatus Tumulicola sp.]
MTIARSISSIFSTVAAAVLLASCSASSIPPSSAAPAGIGTSANRIASQLRYTRSWVAPDARHHDLLYISDLTNQVVSMYSWPEGKLKGQITGFFNPEGLCVDSVGNVWVTNDTGDGVHQITEYAHGETTPIANLIDNDGRTNACSIDPVTGDLAVANFFGATGLGSVSIYKNAQGTPLKYISPAIYYYYYCGYDNKGNFFVDGWSSGSTFGFAELPKGGTKLKTIELNHSITYPGGVQWDGKHMAVGDQYGPIYQFDIKGSNGKLVGTTPLNEEKQIVQFWVQGAKVIGPNEFGANVMIWNYPAGGTPIMTLTGPGIGATISKAKS